MTKKAMEILSRAYDVKTEEIISQKCESQYDGIIERLPYVGGIRNFYTPIIIVNGWFVCMYKSMSSEGIEDDVIGYVISEATDELFDHIPGFLGKTVKGVVFSGFFRRFITRQAKKSQKMKYEYDWVYTVEFPKWGKKKEEREISLLFSECGVHKYYEQEESGALKKYCNFCDPQYSKRYDLGLDASRTMAQGCKECRLTFNNMRETVFPDNIVLMQKNAKSFLSIDT
jgi:hypothetical protein